MPSGVGRDGFTVAGESEVGGQFVGDELEVGWALERQESLQKLADLYGPSRVVVAAGVAGGEVHGLVQAGGPQAKEVGAADAQQLGSGEGAQVAPLEGVQGLAEELRVRRLAGWRFSSGHRSGRGSSLLLFPPQLTKRKLAAHS